MNRLKDDLDHILKHTEGLWDELRGKRIFITGGTGFVGSWLLESLLWANKILNLGSSALILTRDPKRYHENRPYLANDPDVKLIPGDMASFDFPNSECHYLIHAATETSPSGLSNEPFHEFKQNLDGTFRVIELACTRGVKKVLFTSSGAAYGSQPSDISHVQEENSGGPCTTETGTSYGQSKRACEFIGSATANSQTFDFMVARCFAFVGPYLPMDANLAIGNFIRDALGGGPIVVNSDGTPFRSYLYSADLAIWLWTILLKGANCRTYNVGSEVEIQISTLAEIVRDVVNPSAEIIIKFPRMPGQNPTRYVPSTKRAQTELGLQQLISLDDAIYRTAHFVKHGYVKSLN